MKFIRTSVTLALATLFCSNSALADFSFSADFTRLSDRVDLDVVSVGIGYEYQIGESNFNIMPILKYGIGIGDDNFFGSQIEADSFIETALRVNYQFTDQAYAYAQVGYSELTVEFSRFESDEWEFGGGLGAGYKLSDEFALEASWQDFDNTDVYSVGLRYRF